MTTKTKVRAVKVGTHSDLFKPSSNQHVDWRTLSVEKLKEIPGSHFSGDELEEMREENPDLFEELQEHRIDSFVDEMVKYKDDHIQDTLNGHTGRGEYAVDEFQKFVEKKSQAGDFDKLRAEVEAQIDESLDAFSDEELAPVLSEPDIWEVQAEVVGRSPTLRRLWFMDDDDVADYADGRKYNEYLDEKLSLLNDIDVKDARRRLERSGIYMDLQGAMDDDGEVEIHYGETIRYYPVLNRNEFNNRMAENSRDLGRIKSDPTEQNVVYTFLGGDYVADLTPEQLPYEGRMQRHCVGRPGMGYACRVRDNQIKIYSLRFANTKAQLTLEVELQDGKPHHVVQVKGLGNRKPGFNDDKSGSPFTKPDEVRKVVEFIEKHLKLDPKQAEDLKPALAALEQHGAGAPASAVTQMNGDQLAILRLLAKNGGQLTVREIEKSRLGNTPWFKRWLQVEQPKKDVVVTIRDIEESDVTLPATEPRDITDEMLKVAATDDIDWNDEHSILPNNRIFALTVPLAEVPRLFAPYGPEAVSFVMQYNNSAQRSGHPVIDGKVILAWVRYSELDDGTVWVHEVQTDMFWAVGARHLTRRDVEHAMSLGGPMTKETNMHIRDVIKQRTDEADHQMSLLELEALKSFVARKSGERVIFPTMKYRVNNYPADIFGDKSAPASVYNELPKKLRFEKMYTKSLDLPVEVPPGEVWVQASVGGLSVLASVSRTVRYLLADNQHHVVLAMSLSDEVDELVQAIAKDPDMQKLVLRGHSSLGLRKLRMLATVSGSHEARRLARLLTARNMAKADTSISDQGMDQDQVLALAKRLLKNNKLVDLTLSTLFKPANWKHVSDWSEKTWTAFIKENSERKLPLLKAGKITAAMEADDLRLAARLIEGSPPMVTGDEILSAEEREQLNAALVASGFAGGKDFVSLHAAMEELAQAVAPLGFSVAGKLEAQHMGEPTGSASVRLARRSVADSQVATDIGNSVVQVQWFERGPDNVEFVAVAS